MRVTRSWKRNLAVVWIAGFLAIMGFSSTFLIYSYCSQY